MSVGKWLSTLASGGGGFLLGLLVRTEAGVPAAEDPRAPVRSMVCAERPLVTRPSRPAEEAHLAHQWCLGQLSRLQAEQQATLNAWPEHREYAASEEPAVWNQTIEEVFEACDLPGDLVVTDCTEPPCVAALRVDDTAAFEGALRGCPDYAAAFPDPEVGPVSMSVRCADGSVDRMVLLTTFDHHQRGAYFDDLGLSQLMEEDVLDPLSEGYRILSRRADAIEHIWDCESPPRDTSRHPRPGPTP